MLPWLNIEVLHFDHRFGGAGKQQMSQHTEDGNYLGKYVVSLASKFVWEDLLLHPVRHLKYFGTAPLGAPKGTGTGSHLACGAGQETDPVFA